ncbi:hypothetical protein AMES_0578 [Amycolatopsis mediterranei S699]|uniref:Membrane-associated oxidoreductase n=2 Tax=Amycolatopsis mediterranei TaxID=33910 RepID=A0A0H3CWH6_AMYMU|nr:conserved hypothetical protein [Amycolatopsis mediterranei U32]AFO74114.1 hypothetical protein AMES_0578 [Amycolatopsis mediterranei S699]AGT81243.1 hypothetical protein B737_0579 [Amycolatopsis mediterranei RB]
MLIDVTELEQQVVDTARRGEVAKPAITMTVEELAVTDDPDLRVRADLIRELLRGLRGGLDPRGVRIEGVRVVGQLDLIQVTAVTGLNLSRCALPDGIRCEQAHLRYLSLNRSLLAYLSADGLRVDGGLFLRGATITGAGELGALRLLSAHIGGPLELERATITNTAGPALNADGLRADDNLLMGGVTFSGAGARGAVRLLGAHIGGAFELDQAAITNTTGPALNADGLRADSELFMRAATITGAGELGALRLSGAHIGGAFELDQAAITNTTGPALNADGLRADSELFMRAATITGAGELGALRLSGAHIGGQASLWSFRLYNSSGPLLELPEAQITGALLFPPEVVCPASPHGTSRRGCPYSDRTITVHGLTYSTLREISWRQWLHLLVHHTPTYWPQPFQQLAATERAAGHDNNAREVLITQQDELRRRTPEALGNRLAQWRHGLWGWLGRYGYRAHRLVAALVVILTLAAGLSLLAGQVTTHPGHHAAERVPPATANPNAPGTPCSPVELIGLGIDRGLPSAPPASAPTATSTPPPAGDKPSPPPSGYSKPSSGAWPPSPSPPTPDSSANPPDRHRLT